MSEIDTTGNSDTKTDGPAVVKTREGHGSWVEIGSAILLSIAMIASAWCAYQAARWSGVQTIEFSHAAANRNRSTKAADRADTDIMIDISVFLDYALLYMQETVDQEALDIFKEYLFTDRLKVATEAWVATDPEYNPNAPQNPFYMSEYKVSSIAVSEAYDNLADMESETAKHANQQSDNYVLLTVLFAIVLFFAGVSAKFKKHWLNIATLVLGGLIFYITAISLSFQAVH